MLYIARIELLAVPLTGVSARLKRMLRAAGHIYHLIAGSAVFAIRNIAPGIAPHDLVIFLVIFSSSKNL